MMRSCLPTSRIDTNRTDDRPDHSGHAFAIAGPRLLGTQKKADIKGTKAQIGL